MGSNPTFTYGHRRTIELGDHDLPGIDVPLQPLRDLPVNVTFRGCSPYALRIEAANSTPMHPPIAESLSGLDGTAVLHRLVPGPYRVYVHRAESYYSPNIESMRLGDRDVQKDGFDGPVSGDETLQIVVTCGR